MAEQADLSDLPTLMSHLLAGAPRGGDPATSRLPGRRRRVAAGGEAKVQRGMAVAPQTLAAERSLKVEQLQARLPAACPPTTRRANTTAYALGRHAVRARRPGRRRRARRPWRRGRRGGPRHGPPRAFKTWVEAPSTQGSAAGSSAPSAPAAAAEAEVDVMVQNLKQRFRQSGVALRSRSTRAASTASARRSSPSTCATR